MTEAKNPRDELQANGGRGARQGAGTAPPTVEVGNAGHSQPNLWGRRTLSIAMAGQQFLGFPAAILHRLDLLPPLLQQPGSDAATIERGGHGLGIATAGHLGPHTRDKVRLLNRLRPAGERTLLIGRLLQTDLLHHALPQGVRVVGVGGLKGGQIGCP